MIAQLGAICASASVSAFQTAEQAQLPRHLRALPSWVRLATYLGLVLIAPVMPLLLLILTLRAWYAGDMDRLRTLSKEVALVALGESVEVTDVEGLELRVRRIEVASTL